jgi:alkaline phosphatase
MKRLIEEEEELKSQPNKVNFCLQTHYAWIVSALSVISLASVIVAVTLSAVLVRNSSSSSNSKAPKNVIFMVADGFGPASQVRWICFFMLPSMVNNIVIVIE